MLNALHWAAVVLAAIGLVAMLRRRFAPASDPRGRDVPTAFIFLCLAVLVSALPRALRVDDPQLMAATSFLSMTLNIGAIIYFMRARKARPRP